MKCLNPWDVQSKHIQPENGIAECLWAGDARYGGGESYVLQKQTEIVCMATQQGGAEIRTDDKSPCLTASAGMSGNNQPVICLQGNGIDRADTAGCNGKGWNDQTCYTLNTIDRPAVAYSVGNGQTDGPRLSEKAGTLNCMHDQQAIMYSFDSLASNSMKSGNPNSGCREVTVAKTLDTTDPNPSKNQGGVAIVQEVYENHSQDSRFTGPLDVAQPVTATYGAGGNNTPLVVSDSPVLMDAYQRNVGAPCARDYKGVGSQYVSEDKLVVQTKPQYIVRRLTPLECERLQGFPDGWTDIGEWTDSSGKRKQATDSARYKALGNSIAIPPWTFVLQNLILWCGADATMASLFDGIGGFPLIWNRLGGRTLWASEIEEFPIAVTKLHFPEVTQ